MARRSILPVSRSRITARATYDQISRYYDLISSSEAKVKSIAQKQLAVQPGDTVLEIGCGTGKSLTQLTESVGQTGQVFGLDLSSGMLKVAKHNICSMDCAKSIQLVQGDGTYLPFPDHRFNAIFMSFTLELFDIPEIPSVLAECSRILQPTGRLEILSLLRQENPIVHLYEWLHQRLPSLIDCRPIYPAEALEQAGFIISEIQTLALWGLPVESVSARKPSG